MARLWVQTTGFGVCLWQSLNNSPGHLSNAQRQRMTIEKSDYCWLSEHIVFRKQNNVKKNSIVRDENAYFPVY